MKKEVLKKLQMTELEILKEIDRICKKNDIKYFLSFGTLIGCIRHKGFIPWDDDIDIVMPRNDYNRFIKIAPLELDNKYELDCIYTNKKYYLPFLKVRNKLTRFKERNTVNYNGPKGIWVDIFPFDNTKETIISKKIKVKTKIKNFLSGILIYKSLKLNNYGLKVKLLSKVTTNKFLIKMIDLICTNKKEFENFIFYSEVSYDKSLVCKKSDIFPLIELEFEGEKFWVPKNYHDILTKMYGDYMKLPPVNERITHNPLKIVFEDGEKYEFPNNN